MKAIRIEDSGPQIADMPVPKSTERETLVRVLHSGICNTDLEMIKGYGDFRGTLGHEFVGIVEEGPEELLGQRVVGEINAGCGECENCASGDPRHCPDRTVLGIVGRDGSHAEFLTLPPENLLKVPDDISDRAAVFVEPLAAAWGITEQVDIDSDTRVCVVGDGKLGVLCARALNCAAGSVLVVGKHREKLEVAAKGGIESVLLDDAAGRANSFDVVVEASGSPSGFETAVKLVRPRGKVVLKSTFHGPAEWEAWRVVVDEITVVGSRCGRFAPAIKLLADRRVEVEDLVSAEFELKDAAEAMGAAASPGAFKVLLNAV